MATRWDAATLHAARNQGDPDADQLIAAVLTHSAGTPGISRGGYNHLLDLANVMISNPELSLVRDSRLRRQLDAAGTIATFFDPVEAPAWVDERKIVRAAELWQTDSILCIAVLYGSSLPACYLMQKGVPALYATEKLSEQKYVFQRIYETGLMLEGVMSPGGIKVVHDVEPNTDAAMADALNAVDPDGQWRWEHHRLRRQAGESLRPIDAAEAQRRFHAGRQEAKRYLWGGGIVAARKVRFLHAAMRQMLLNPAAMQRQPGASADDRAHSFMDHAARRVTRWDDANGVPINQEDLAFVLLTFGYLIPKGMETWGRRVPRDQKEAFLHLWRVVGHVMGIRDDLMTDDLDQARVLYEQLLEKNAATSEPGRILTTGLMNFLRSYLPARFGLSGSVPAALIIDQLGPEKAKLIVNDADYRAARRPATRFTHGFARSSIKLYYWLREHLLSRLPLVGPGVSTVTEQAAEAMINSWRESFLRHPFYVPAQATTWVQQRGVTPEYEKKLADWRQSMFDTLAAGLGGLIVAGFALALALVFAFVDLEKTAAVTGVASATAFVLGLWALRFRLPQVARKRPTLASPMTR
jgi:hypothetical protein